MEKLLFYHLAPTSEADIDYYKEALDYMFEHPEIKNIAITDSLIVKGSFTIVNTETVSLS